MKRYLYSIQTAAAVAPFMFYGQNVCYVVGSGVTEQPATVSLHQFKRNLVMQRATNINMYRLIQHSAIDGYRWSCIRFELQIIIYTRRASNYQPRQLMRVMWRQWTGMRSKPRSGFFLQTQHVFSGEACYLSRQKRFQQRARMFRYIVHAPLNVPTGSKPIPTWPCWENRSTAVSYLTEKPVKPARLAFQPKTYQ